MGKPFISFRSAIKLEEEMRLVNEFQRHHPPLCKPSQQPDFRFIRVGSQEQNLQLEKLIADVLTLDCETQPKPKPLSKARA